MKKTFLDIGRGVVLANAVAAILRPVESADQHGCTVLLKGGQHLPTDRPYDEIVSEVEELMLPPVLTEMVPELMTAFEQLKHRMSTPEETPTLSDTSETPSNEPTEPPTEDPPVAQPRKRR